MAVKKTTKNKKTVLSQMEINSELDTVRHKIHKKHTSD